MKFWWTAASCWWVGGVDHNFTRLRQGPGGVQVLEGWQISANHLLSRANGMLQSALVLGSGSSVSDGDGGGENGLNDDGVEVDYHCLWQVELLWLLQGVHPLLGLLGDGADVQLPLEVLGDGGAQEMKGLHSVNWGVTQGDGGRWGWVFLHCLESVELQVVLTTPGH